MRNYFLLFIFSFPYMLWAQGLTIQSPLRYLALGDSYTIGQSVSPVARWPAQLADSLALRGYETEALRVIATTGWRTDNLINAVRNQNLEDENYNLVSILIGVSFLPSLIQPYAMREGIRTRSLLFPFLIMPIPLLVSRALTLTKSVWNSTSIMRSVSI